MVGLITVLLILGIVLLIVELVVPGFGASGISGIALILVSAVLSTRIPPVYMAIIIGIIVAIAVYLFYIIRKKHALKGLVLNDSLKEAAFDVESIYHLINKTGVVESPLKPYGVVDFGGELHEAFSEIGYIEKGAQVKCIQIHGKNIIVREIPAED